MTGQEANGIIAAILLALGVAAPVPEFTGGMLLALGAAYAVRAFRGAETRKGIVLSLFAGAFFALLAAGLHEATAGVWLWGQLSIQAQMAVSGGLSQSLAEGFVAFGGGLKDWLAKLPGGFGKGADR
ncbi:hypothetical protein [Sphingopyxis indica]|uniref:Phage holin n=1 Tax=Sphingopyxis indica TaxID=436663 RepID=A0A239KNX3_9SPHN|nr:hypothetical protein [Sphingopyxis indica]SNT19249.1 hypothetical protein SAMN06295955_11543 [Sphingopyxis indica]